MPVLGRQKPLIPIGSLSGQCPVNSEGEVFHKCIFYFQESN